MKLKNEIISTFENVNKVISIKRYRLITLISGLIIFSFLYYLLIAKVADNDIWISVMMSGAAFITTIIITLIITSTFSGILLSMLLYKYSLYNRIIGKGFIGFIGSGIASFGVGCPTCGAFMFGLMGMPLVLMYLPFKGMELQFLGIFVLLISIYLTSKSIKGVCKI